MQELPVLTPLQMLAGGGSLLVLALASCASGGGHDEASAALDSAELVLSGDPRTPPPKGGPELVGVALYHDVNGDGSCNQGDELVLTYDSGVAPPRTASVPFELPVNGDQLGLGAFLRRGPGPSQVTIVLGEDPVLRTRGLFEPNARRRGSPSGIANAWVDEAQAVLSSRDQKMAYPGEAVDIVPDLTPAPSALGTDPTQAVAAGDLDGDGDLDVVTVHADLPLRVWHNVGGALFDQGTQMIPARQASSVVLGDLDGDLDLDLVVGSVGQAAQVWWNRGLGTFDRGPSLGAGRTRGIALGDLNGDRLPDVLLGNDGANQAWLNRGGQQFAPGDSFGATATRDIALGDVDGDGDLDAVEAVQSGSGRSGHPIWINDGRGRFRASEDLGRGDSLGVVLADFDRDGDLDLLGGDRGRGRILLGNGSGLFVGGQVLEATVPWVPAVGDLDGDGQLDVVQSRARETVWWRGAGNGRFVAGGGVLPVGRANDSALADVDRDGDLDLLLATNEGTTLWLGSLAGTRGSLRFGDSMLELSPRTTLALAIADLDRDGHTDVVQASGDGVFVHPGRGAGGFEPAIPVGGGDSAQRGATALALADVDASGRKDLVVGGLGATRVWLAPTRGFNYRPGPLIESGLVTALGVADYDTDGDLDLALGLDLEPQPKIWLQEHRLRFDYPQLFEAEQREDFGSVGSLAHADLDGDGQLDMVVGSRVGRPTSLWRNMGQARFELLAEMTTGVTLALATGDIDRDGDIDLLCGDARARELDPCASVWINDGLGGFTRSSEFATGGLRAALLVDLNEDGWLDALLGFQDAPCAVWLGTGAGEFRQEVSFGVAPTSALLAHDFDGDGDLDVLQGRDRDLPDRVWWQE